MAGRTSFAIGRRAFLAASAGAMALPPPAARDARWLAAIVARATALGGAGLLQSYEVQAGATPFDRAHGDCAYVYDNAVAGLALLAGGRTDLAARLGEALVQAQGRDRFWRDGRLRNAYKSGATPAAGPYPLPGWWDAPTSRWLEDGYQVGTATGVLAWAMMLWLALGRATGDARYQAAANRAADWIVQKTRVTAGFSGGFLGFEPGPERLGWVSTEHNLDVLLAFQALGGRAGDAALARRFLNSMWRPQEGRFMAGLRPDGTVNPAAAVDANLWPGLAIPGQGWEVALDWVLAHQGVPAAMPAGVDFNDDRDGIWLEGTAYVALAAAARPQLRARMMDTLSANTAPSGFVWATSVPRLSTGFATGLGEDFVYYRRPHLAATAWAALPRWPS
jgi:hypothetical protein